MLFWARVRIIVWQGLGTSLELTNVFILKICDLLIGLHTFLKKFMAKTH